MGRGGAKAGKDDRAFLYRGISSRPFKRQFSLADYMQVRGASFDNGLLKIDLVREVPEAMKPRRIPIQGAAANNDIAKRGADADAPSEVKILRRPPEV